MGRLFIILGGLLLSTWSCTHIVPKAARTMPLIRVSHQGAVETLPLESYVASVLAGEVSPSWPIEALKAQAIASRTFALKRMKERKDRSHHVENSYMDQVFRHKPAPIFIEAVKETAGQVLSLDGVIIEASFHSTCGGHTANAKDVWGKSYPYLKGVPCSFCKNSPSYKWSSTMNTSELEKKLSQKFSRIDITKRSADERTLSLKLSGEKAKDISGHQFRMKAGPLKIKSTMITGIEFKDNRVTISGMGFGHGVGLCQYGALGMAKNGSTAQEILAHYYPGTSLKRLY